ncbi:MAG: C25 family cysteine peptidase [Candidatus Zixiibacteriota bacterium]
MSRRLMLTAVIFFVLLSPIFAEYVDLGTNVDNVAVSVQESNDVRTVVRYEIGSYVQAPVTIDNTEYFMIGLDDEGIIQTKGAPSLPRVSRSIIIPDDARMDIKVLESEFVEFENVLVAPSKGNLTRDINPADVPFEFGAEYSTDAYYPSDLVALRDPYILRDYRGLVIDLNAVQYNPVTKTLRIYTAVTVEVFANGAGRINTIDDRKSNSVLVEEFDKTYQRHFINYGFQTDKYTHLVDRGDMLIITYDSFHDAVVPLANWKIQKGIRTTILDVSDIGNTTTAIKNTILSYYNDPDYDLAWVLLVGDHAQITSFSVSGGASDPTYALLAGSDSYPDIFIGRFSAETVAQAETQVARTITYETNPGGSNWFHRATGIGSAEGAGQGHNGEADYVHMGYIRDDLMGYNYDVVDQIYDPGASSSQVTTAVNAGRGFINYTGHGSTTAWSTTGFSNTNVNNLTNDGMLPFIVSVACVNGNFASSTCFGEAWLRATNGANPTGAIGAYMSSINQDWVPPMHAQDECTDLLIAEAITTFGGLCFNGSCKMIDLSGSSGIEMYETWHIFGDPSVQLWTDDPATMTVSHDDVLLIGTTETTIDVGVEGALCAITFNNEIIGRGYTDASGTATVSFDTELPVGEDVTITVTAFNYLPYTTTVTVITPNGPYLVYDNNDIDDFAGNNNGVVDYGETVSIGVQLKNVGPDVASAVEATLTTTDSYITITDGTESFGDIDGDNGTGYVSNAFTFDVSPNVPDGHIISFTLTMIDVNDSTWTSGFSVVAHAPVLGYLAVTVNDESGNDNGVFDPGETVDLIVAIGNTGSGDANEITAVLGESDTYIDINDGDGSYDDIISAGSGENEFDVFSASADAGCPRGHEVTFTLNVSAANGLIVPLQFTMIIGDRVVFFADDFSFNQGWTGLGGNAEWTIGAATGGAGSDSYGGADPAIDHSPTADNGVMGNDLTSGTGGDYAGGLSSTYWVTSPVIDCGDFNGCVLGFWRWLGVEQSSYDHAYLQVFDGSSWVQIFANGSANIDETAWSEQTYDVSAYADSNSAFQIRFGLGGTDGSMNWCGWNIDDLWLKGYGERKSADIYVATTAVADSLVPGDVGNQNVLVYNESTETILRVSFGANVSWLSFDTEQQLVDPSDSLVFPLTITTAGMEPGDYSGLLTYSCNDYGHQYDTIEVTLHLFAPDISVSTDPLSASCGAGETTSCGFTINNVGPGRLTYAIGCQMFDGKRGVVTAAKPVLGDPIGYHPAGDKGDIAEPFYSDVDRSAGGPDTYGYSWIDSDDAAGPTFEWIDISTIGTDVVSSMTDDNAVGPISMGMSFPFYDSTYSQIYIGSNGVLGFGAGATSRTNQNLPSATAPNNLIAILWDDLDPPENGHVYYYNDVANNRFIVSYEDVRYYTSPDGAGSLTFQAILYANGQVVLQYGTVDAGAHDEGHLSNTIGLENVDGSDGLTVVYNAAYIHDNMAISFKAARWMSVLPSGGTIEPFSSQQIAVNFDATELTNGTYGGQLTVLSNDGDQSSVTIPVSLSISSYTCGDADGDASVNVGDAVFLVNYIFNGGAAPNPIAAADCNGDTNVNIADAVYLINYIFKAGPAPACQ